jgi:hypothetical protein
MQAADTVASSSSTRIGIAYFVNSFAFLTGPPISGALLGNQINWDKPAIFGGVCIVLSEDESLLTVLHIGGCSCWFNPFSSARTNAASQEERDTAYIISELIFPSHPQYNRSSLSGY